MLEEIFASLPLKDINACRAVESGWQDAIDSLHLLERRTFLNLHPFSYPIRSQTGAVPPNRGNSKESLKTSHSDSCNTASLSEEAAESASSTFNERCANLAVERYNSLIRGWLKHFSETGINMAEQLDEVLEGGRRHFAEVLFFSIAKLLVNTEKLACLKIATIEHSDGVKSASFSPDRKHLVTASRDCTAKILGLEGGNKTWGIVGWKLKEIAIIQHAGGVNDACFSPDGNHLVTASDDKTSQIWGLVEGQWQKITAIRHDNPAKNACFSPDGKTLVIVSGDEPADSTMATIWDLDDGQCQKKVSIKHPGLENVRFSPDGKHLMMGSCFDEARIWKLVNDQWQDVTPAEYKDSMMNACFSPDGNYLVLGSRSYGPGIGPNAEPGKEGDTRILELIEGQWKLKRRIVCKSSVNDARFSPDGKHFVIVTDYTQSAQIYSIVGGEWELKATIKHYHFVKDVNFSPDGEHLVTASYTGTARIWGIFRGEWIEKAIIRPPINPHKPTYAIRGCHLTKARFGPDGNTLVTTREAGIAEIWVFRDLAHQLREDRRSRKSGSYFGTNFRKR